MTCTIFHFIVIFQKQIIISKRKNKQFIPSKTLQCNWSIFYNKLLIEFIRITKHAKPSPLKTVYFNLQSAS